MKRKLIMLCLSATIMLGTISSVVSAKSLAASFSGGTYVVNKATRATKTAWAKTEGYSGKHYVRAYIGGTRSSAEKAVSDTRRQYSNGDIWRAAKLTYVSSGKSPVIFNFPTGYAKYGK